MEKAKFLGVLAAAVTGVGSFAAARAPTFEIPKSACLTPAV